MHASSKHLSTFLQRPSQKAGSRLDAACFSPRRSQLHAIKGWRYTAHTFPLPLVGLGITGLDSDSDVDGQNVPDYACAVLSTEDRHELLELRHNANSQHRCIGIVHRDAARSARPVAVAYGQRKVMADIVR